MLRSRVLSTIVLVPVLVGLLILGGVPWLFAVLLAGVLAGRELYGLTSRAGYRVYLVPGLTWLVLLVLEGFWSGSALLRPLLWAGIAATLVWSLAQRDDAVIARWSVTAAGALYLGLPLAHMVALRQMPDGLWWLMLALGSVWLGDMAAYAVGMTAGRHKLCPRLSPGKTWEGSIAGLLFTMGGVVASVAACRRWLPQSSVAQMAWSWSLLLGVLLGPLALAGDLVVSMFKRRATVKDSGRLIPGHGGMLDRLDSLLLTVPLVYYWSLIVG